MTQSAPWAGISFTDIDGLTPGDIVDIVNIEAEKQKDFYQMMAWIVYTGAYLTAIGYNNPKKFPTIDEAFPTLFEKKEQQDWRIMKERVEQYKKMKRQK